MIRTLFIFVISILLLSGCRNTGNDFNEPVTSFQKRHKDITALYVYPGTLKMMNTNNDSTVNELIRGIKKSKFIHWVVVKDSVITDSCRLVMKKEIDSISKELKGENFSELMKFRKDNVQIMLYQRKYKGVPVEYVGLFNGPEGVYIGDLLGNISLKELPGLLNGKSKFSGFQTILEGLQIKRLKTDKKHDSEDTGDQ